ncbi:ANR family transcriptional regulator [Escherichia coli]|uniref:ANR family transcriptional regulator n=1 Tax=Escherichia coli TaxID=562 RepID=UPI0007A581E6|nr:ANR family transcriptional regulator [Escherichia coli]
MSFKYRDNPLYYRAAREALRLEQSGEYDRAAKVWAAKVWAAKVWAKANRESHHELNQEWSERRSEFCLMQNMREKRKAVEE